MSRSSRSWLSSALRRLCAVTPAISTKTTRQKETDSFVASDHAETLSVLGTILAIPSYAVFGRSLTIFSSKRVISTGFVSYSSQPAAIARSLS